MNELLAVLNRVKLNAEHAMTRIESIRDNLTKSEPSELKRQLTDLFDEDLALTYLRTLESLEDRIPEAKTAANYAQLVHTALRNLDYGENLYDTIRIMNFERIAKETSQVIAAPSSK